MARPRLNLTPEESQARRRQQNSNSYHNVRSNETPRDRARRQARGSANNRAYLNRLSTEQRANRSASNSSANSIRRQNETPTQRVQRLDSRSSQYYSQNSLSGSSQSSVASVGTPPVRNPTRRQNLYLAAVLNEHGKLRNGLPEVDYLGPLDQECLNCHALHFDDERKRNVNRQNGTYSDCCDFGKMDPALFDFPPYPEGLQALFDDPHFSDNIRLYNNSVALGSICYTSVRAPTRGARLFKVQGAVYHCVYNLNDCRSNRNSDLGKCNQLWFLDTQVANQQRIERTPVLQEDILVTLKRELERANNDLYAQYKPMHTLVTGSNEEMVIQFERRPAQLPNFQDRLYDLPAAREVVGVMATRSDDARGVVAYPRCQYYQQRFDFKEGVCDALCYPLLNPWGMMEWSHDRLKNLDPETVRKVTLMHFYAYRTSIRFNQFNQILMSKDLFQQYLVDAYSKILQERLEYFRKNQVKFWCEEFQTLQNLNILDANGELDQEMLKQFIGQKKIIPASFPDSRRFRQKKFDDAMSTVARYGKPDFWITFTCNPKWREIQENLMPGQKAEDRPDLVNRVFDNKVRRLIDEIYKKGVLGKCVAYIGCVEFQKRGLPHIHLLVTVEPEDKPSCPEQIDRVISAEIPDPTKGEEEAAHYQILYDHMLHRKCGSADPTAVCMRDRRPRVTLVDESDDSNDLQFDADGNVIINDSLEQILDEALAQNGLLNVQPNDSNDTIIVGDQQVSNATTISAETQFDSNASSVEDITGNDHPYDDSSEDEPDDEDDDDEGSEVEIELGDLNDDEFGTAQVVDSIMDAQFEDQLYRYDSQLDDHQVNVYNEQIDHHDNSGYVRSNPLLTPLFTPTPVPNETNPNLGSVSNSNPIDEPVTSSQNNRAIVSFGNVVDSSARVCSKGFPKPFCDRTHFRNKYPVYRRPDNGRSIAKGPISNPTVYDNQWVVAMNLYLSRRFDAHINVELCATSCKVCTYLYLYMHKGGDKADLSFRQADNPDEIKAYLDCKYITPHEAHYRIHSLKMYYSSHVPVDLTIHLLNRHLIFYREGNVIRARRQHKNTHLTAWFELNRQSQLFDDADWLDRGESWCTHTYTDADTNVQKSVRFKLLQDSRLLHYFEIPEHFVFKLIKGGHHYWSSALRSRKVIGRIHKVTCGINASEKYFLRMLLLHVKGATGFNDLKRVPNMNNEQPFSTYKEACIARGLLIDDQEHDRCLNEASLYHSAGRFRYLFIFLLSLGTVLDPAGLYNKYHSDLIHDYALRFPPQRALCALFLDLERLSMLFNFEFSSLPWVVRPEGCPDNVESLLDAENLEQLRADGDLRYSQLNVGQKVACDAIELCVRERSVENNFFEIKGSAGTGKTFLYRAIYNRLVGEGKRVLCVAWSGIAATLLPKGQTAHSAFGFKLDMTADDYTSTINMQSKRANFLRSLDLIIWDEISMVPYYALKSLDELLRELKGEPNLLFGGVTVVVGGDFRQILPIINGGSRTDIVCSTVKFFDSWDRRTTFHLTTNVRCSDPFYREYSLKIGDGLLGTVTNEANGEKEIPIEQKFLFPVDQPLSSFISEIFPDRIFQIADPVIRGQQLAKRAIVCPYNYLGDQINSFCLNKSPGVERCYASSDSICLDGALHPDFQNVENLYVENPPGFPPHELKLKKGAIVMCLRNMSVGTSLTNGTRLIVEHMGDYNISCRRLESVPGCDDIVDIARIPFIIPASVTSLEFDFKRFQFPLRLAFAMTINKSQGQTLESVGVCLQTPVFSHGQLFVAISRVTNPDGLRIFKQSRDGVQNEAVTMRNVVWSDALD